MNFPDFSPSFFLDVAQTVAVVALWLRKPGQDAAQSVATLKGRVDVLEERINHMPNSDELSALEGDVKSIKALLLGQAESQVTMRKSVSRIEDYLLNHK